MPITVTTTWHNAGPHTIWGKLAERLGREPTNAEACAEVKRIMRGDPLPQPTEIDDGMGGTYRPGVILAV